MIPTAGVCAAKWLALGPVHSWRDSAMSAARCHGIRGGAGRSTSAVPHLYPGPRPDMKRKHGQCNSGLGSPGRAAYTTRARLTRAIHMHGAAGSGSKHTGPARTCRPARRQQRRCSASAASAAARSSAGCPQNSPASTLARHALSSPPRLRRWCSTRSRWWNSVPQAGQTDPSTDCRTRRGRLGSSGCAFKRWMVTPATEVKVMLHPA